MSYIHSFCQSFFPSIRENGHVSAKKRFTATCKVISCAVVFFPILLRIVYLHTRAKTSLIDKKVVLGRDSTDGGNNTTTVNTAAIRTTSISLSIILGIDCPYPMSIICYCADAENKLDRINEILINLDIKTSRSSRRELQIKKTYRELYSLFCLHRDLLHFWNPISMAQEGAMCNGFFGEENFSKEEIQSQLRKQYDSQSDYSYTQPSGLPDFPSFKAEDWEYRQIFAALLSKSNGFILGEIHRQSLPKVILAENMAELYKLGVRTLFLEFCCIDTLQNELDNFYKTKEPSQFLKMHLQSGYGLHVPEGAAAECFNVVEAAVKAGICPVGLETSVTQDLGYSFNNGSHGEGRMLGMNMPAKKIIERVTNNGKDGKYVALVGNCHLSWAYNIPGLSELCQVPSVFIYEDQAPTSYQTYVSDENIKKELANTTHSHVYTVQINVQKDAKWQ